MNFNELIEKIRLYQKDQTTINALSLKSYLTDAISFLYQIDKNSLIKMINESQSLEYKTNLLSDVEKENLIEQANQIVLSLERSQNDLNQQEKDLKDQIMKEREKLLEKQVEIHKVTNLLKNMQSEIKIEQILVGHHYQANQLILSSFDQRIERYEKDTIEELKSLSKEINQSISIFDQKIKDLVSKKYEQTLLVRQKIDEAISKSK
jgi:hypothetical protein